MATSHSIKGSIAIDASPEKVWDILTNPEKILLYIGANTTTDWKPGSAITWEGEMGGQKYLNKGKVLESKPYELLKFTYWSNFGGIPETPENYSVITYTLDKADDRKTMFTYNRENIPTSEEKTMFEGHLQFMLAEIKRLAEE
jgi:uncharacterized protein YndB with AHSA1/START domain